MDDAGRGESLREGLRLTILGPPNAGKSSLINALARRDVAIVSDIPGTTRDVVEARLDLGGYLLQVADTAGCAPDRGCDRGRGRAPGAVSCRGRHDAFAAGWVAGRSPRRIARRPARTRPDRVEQVRPGRCVTTAFPFRSRPAKAFRQLVKMLQQKVQQKLESKDGAPLLTRPRHRHALGEALGHLQAWVGRASRIIPNCWRKICGWPCAPSAASPAGWMWKSCWISSSAISASENDKSACPVEAAMKNIGFIGLLRASCGAA